MHVTHTYITQHDTHEHIHAANKSYYCTHKRVQHTTSNTTSQSSYTDHTHIISYKLSASYTPLTWFEFTAVISHECDLKEHLHRCCQRRHTNKETLVDERKRYEWIGRGEERGTQHWLVGKVFPISRWCRAAETDDA